MFISEREDSRMQFKNGQMVNMERLFGKSLILSFAIVNVTDIPLWMPKIIEKNLDSLPLCFTKGRKICKYNVLLCYFVVIDTVESIIMST